jgi:phage terminase small subunit
MPTRDSIATGILSKRMMKFIAMFEGTATVAARRAGYKNPKSSADQLMKNPTVTDAIKKKQDAMAEEFGKRLAQELNFCRTDVLNRIWQIANPSNKDKDDDGPSYETQLKAAQALAEIFDQDISRAAAIAPQLAGKSEAEIEFFLEHGTLPNSGDQNA